MKKRGLALLCALAVTGTGVFVPSMPAAYAAEGDGSNVTYYISSIHGDNSKSGTSPQQAWETLDKLKDIEWGAGVSVLLEKGSEFNGYIHLKDVHGSKENPIRIGSYGEGNKPCINANGQGVWYQQYSENSSHMNVQGKNHKLKGYVSSAILLYDVDFVEVSGLEITNRSDDFSYFGGVSEDYTVAETSGRMDRTGVAGIARDGGTMEHIYLTDLFIHDVDGNIEDKHMDNGGIQLNAVKPKDEAATGVARYHDVQIKNCHVKDVSRAGICVGYTYQGTRFSGREISDEKAKTYGHTGVVLSGNYVQNIGNDGIVAMYAYRPLVENNVSDTAGVDLDVEKGGYANYYGYTNAAIWPWKCKDATFQYNEVFDTVYNQDGMAWDIDYSDGTVYQYNYSHHNGGGCIMFCMGEAYNGVFRYNISQNDLNRLITLSSNPNGEIYNNVFYVDGDNSAIIMNQEYYNGSANIRNNIFYNASTSKGTEANIKHANHSFKNNIFYGYQANVIPENSITSDPLFENGGNAPTSVLAGGGLHDRETAFNGYRLKANSPAINAGDITDGGAKYDFFGNRVGAQPDIGVYESDTEESVLALGGDRITVQGESIKNLPEGMTAGELKERLICARDVALKVCGENGSELADGDQLVKGATVEISKGSETKTYAVQVSGAVVYRDYEPDDYMKEHVTAGSYEDGTSQYSQADWATPPSYALDGEIKTIWHTKWDGTTQSQVWIQVDLGASKPVSRYTYTPRDNADNRSGTITGYKIEVSNDGTSWSEAASGSWSSDISTKVVEFNQVQARYVKLTGTSSAAMNGSKPAGSAAEIRIGYQVEE